MNKSNSIQSFIFMISAMALATGCGGIQKPSEKNADNGGSGGGGGDPLVADFYSTESLDLQKGTVGFLSLVVGTNLQNSEVSHTCGGNTELSLTPGVILKSGQKHVIQASVRSSMFMSIDRKLSSLNPGNLVSSFVVTMNCEIHFRHRNGSLKKIGLRFRGDDMATTGPGTSGPGDSLNPNLGDFVGSGGSAGGGSKGGTGGNTGAGSAGSANNLADQNFSLIRF